MSSDSHPLEPLYVAYLRKVAAWGFPNLPILILELFDQMSYLRFESKGSGYDVTNPFLLSGNTTQADIDSAFQELESLRHSDKPDLAKWFWLEKCQLFAVENATCTEPTEEEIIKAINLFETPLSDTQKDLMLQWSLESLAEIDNEAALTSDLPNEYCDSLIENVINNILEIHDTEYRNRLRVAIEVDEQLSKIFRRKP